MKQKRLPPLPGWKPGFKFYDCGKLCHYVGFMYDGDRRIHTYKHWNLYSQSWVYITKDEELFKIAMPYFIPK